MAQERMYNLALLNTTQDIFHKMDFTDITNLFTAEKKQEKTVVFCSKDLLAILDFVLIYFWTKNSFAVISV